VNINKSKVVALGPRNKGRSELNITYHDKVTILGMEIRNTLRATSIASWKKVTALIKVQTMEDYAQDLNLAQRIHYVHAYLYAQAWHIAQLYVPPEENIRQITAAIARFLWQGGIFREPVTRLYRPKTEGGWSLYNLSVKCRALLYHRLQKQLVTQEILSPIWMRHWGITLKKTNPPSTVAIPEHLDYLQKYVMDDAYIRRQTHTESGRTYKRRICATLQYYNNKAQERREM
jgi:hypothetical protein